MTPLLTRYITGFLEIVAPFPEWSEISDANFSFALQVTGLSLRQVFPERDHT